METLPNEIPELPCIRGEQYQLHQLKIPTETLQGRMVVLINIAKVFVDKFVDPYDLFADQKIQCYIIESEFPPIARLEGTLSSELNGGIVLSIGRGLTWGDTQTLHEFGRQARQLAFKYTKPVVISVYTSDERRANGLVLQSDMALIHHKDGMIECIKSRRDYPQ